MAPEFAALRGALPAHLESRELAPGPRLLRLPDRNRDTQAPATSQDQERTAPKAASPRDFKTCQLAGPRQYVAARVLQMRDPFTKDIVLRILWSIHCSVKT